MRIKVYFNTIYTEEDGNGVQNILKKYSSRTQKTANIFFLSSIVLILNLVFTPSTTVRDKLNLWDLNREKLFENAE